MNKLEQILKLSVLKDNNLIIDNEFNILKKDIFNGSINIDQKQNTNNDKLILDFGNFIKEVDINIKELDLSDNNLSTLPDSIGNLTGLKYLYLYNNNLSKK